MIQKAADWLYPRHCPLCDRLLKREEPMVCASCAENVPLIRGPVCMRCGRPLGVPPADGENPDAGWSEAFRKEYCADCRKRQHSFEQGFAPYIYRTAVQASLLRMKYTGRAEYAGFYAASIWHAGEGRIRRWRPDAIVPVPVHTGRWRRRGYNQAEELAVHLSALSGIPLAEPVWRKRHTVPQRGLTPQERRKNVRGAFRLRTGAEIPRGILLVDDIYTTGSTLDEMTDVLRAGGARKVWFVCAAIAAGEA